VSKQGHGYVHGVRTANSGNSGGVRDADFIQSLERGLAVIRAFDAEHSKLSLSEVAASTGLSRAAARRFLHTLVDLGYMRMDGGQFSLRPKILELGYAYLSSLSLPRWPCRTLSSWSNRSGSPRPCPSWTGTTWST